MFGHFVLKIFQILLKQNYVPENYTKLCEKTLKLHLEPYSNYFFLNLAKWRKLLDNSEQIISEDNFESG